MKAIISGGGSGGHIFPAIAIANAIKARWDDANILFIGAEGRMEMEKVPAAGYEIKALPIAGLQRRLTLKNLAVPFKMMRSQCLVRRIIKNFDPDIVVGVGGYASAPTLETAARMGYKTILQEQNSFPGLTNKMLSKKAQKICVAYDGLEKYFPKDKIVFTGNPVRKDIEYISATREEGCRHFGLDPNKKVVLSVGGSLGAKSINQMIMNHLVYFREKDVQLLWQTGKWMYEDAVNATKKSGVDEWVKVHPFISRMDLAYAAADVVISRAGAIAISELCLVGKPCILIPSPNVAEDHQTKNAMALVGKGAAMMVRDDLCNETGIATMDELLSSTDKQHKMHEAITKLGMHNAADVIVDEIEKIVAKHE
ncbi:MAG: undecaprenyldiphospho-muramoylpentapeptide beta-N-acetylglucosaminyltransferase [Bacteroidales bacterium]|nr:undecaprenyldiphospho-muramoylpentapeptide beta-N-acetylglucosaminyltransferase [Bacteroidales bacterium]